MAKQRKLIEFVCKRERNGDVNDTLSINYETNAAERGRAFESLMRSVLTVADSWQVTPKLWLLAEAIKQRLDATKSETTTTEARPR